ncbi:hypothetical protein EV702DRAFT_1046482 [Suillus placidus]|uniref:Uncharacterized protein n=1 Tax=Suillus placidus TaxID=48579 RepID=A0A9P7D2J4_9AGAM|nr:hypothetical protein EV702DRAFT_1046482 [Suillus placidus]
MSLGQRRVAQANYLGFPGNESCYSAVANVTNMLVVPVTNVSRLHIDRAVESNHGTYHAGDGVAASCSELCLDHTPWKFERVPFEQTQPAAYRVNAFILLRKNHNIVGLGETFMWENDHCSPVTRLSDWCSEEGMGWGNHSPDFRNKASSGTFTSGKPCIYLAAVHSRAPLPTFQDRLQTGRPLQRRHVQRGDDAIASQLHPGCGTFNQPDAPLFNLLNT